jgi:hypothetical protein
MAASWIEEAKQEEVEFFETATADEIDEALRLAGYHEYENEYYEPLSAFPKAQRVHSHVACATSTGQMKGWRRLSGQQDMLATSDEAADDYSYAMAA